MCLNGEASWQWNGNEEQWWNQRWDSLKCGEQVRIEFGNDNNTSTLSGPLISRNLEDVNIDFVRMWSYDAEALIGGVTVFTGHYCGTVSKFLPGA